MDWIECYHRVLLRSIMSKLLNICIKLFSKLCIKENSKLIDWDLNSILNSFKNNSCILFFEGSFITGLLLRRHANYNTSRIQTSSIYRVHLFSCEIQLLCYLDFQEIDWKTVWDQQNHWLMEINFQSWTVFDSLKILRHIKKKVRIMACLGLYMCYCPWTGKQFCLVVVTHDWCFQVNRLLLCISLLCRWWWRENCIWCMLQSNRDISV